MVINGATGCLVGDTKLFQHKKSFEELYNSGERIIDTVSITPGNYPKKTKSELFYSGEKEVFEIELDDNKKVIATEDHKFFKQEGHIFKETTVKDLVVGDKLRSCDLSKLNKYWDTKKEYYSKW